MPHTPISFNDTEIAFTPKSTKELKQAKFLFALMGYNALVKLGTRLTPWAIRIGLPIKGIIRNTIFKQFVGGESLAETAQVATKLAQHNVQVILDYGVEGGDYNAATLDHASDQFVQVITYAATQPNIPYISIKVTGIARFALLELLDAYMHQTNEPTLIKKYTAALQLLSTTEQAEWQQVILRLTHICNTAQQHHVGVLVDAEETWIQDPVDALTMLMMDAYNKTKPTIYNTIQLYRHDRLSFLQDSTKAATERNFILGVKLVRGAYMEKESTRANNKGYTNPIQPSKATTDNDYNAAIAWCVQHIHITAFIVASHNEKSNLYTTQLLIEAGHNLRHAHVHFSQLYGMSDNITFNLANAGCSVSKYLPFGPIKDVIPYLMRRAQENSSVSGQTGRELSLIKKELARRKQ